MPDISIVIPAYNEARRLPSSINALKKFLSKQNFLIEIIVIVELSSDKTYELSLAAIDNDCRFKLVKNLDHRGKGYAVRTGMQMATGNIVFFMDCDLSTSLNQINTFLEYFNRYPNVDCVIGSRTEIKSIILNKQNIFRRFLGLFFNRLVTIFGVRGVSDTQCGFKAFRQRCVGPVFARQKIDGFAFDVEILLLLQKQDFEVRTLPVEWTNSSDSKVRPFIDPILMLFDLFKMHHIVNQSLKDKPQIFSENRNKRVA